MLSSLKNKLPDIETVDLVNPSAKQVPFEAAVLAPFTSIKGEPHLILTQRSQEMRAHAGEVAFPGGKVDAVDKTLLDTALRESNEEIGLLSNQVELIGQIGSVQSRAGLRIQPYVGIVDEGLEFSPETEELDAVFKVPTSLFFDKDAIIMHSFAMDSVSVEVPGFKFEDFTIWGLTAAMIVTILNHLGDDKIVLPDIRYHALGS